MHRYEVDSYYKKTYTATFKAQVVQELLQETKTLTQLATEHGIHPNVLREWRTTALAGLPSLFRPVTTITGIYNDFDKRHNLEHGNRVTSPDSAHKNRRYTFWAMNVWS
jgi:transposase-like protein